MSKQFTSIKKILVGIDGSVHSKKAVELAVDLAKKYDATVYLIHVMDVTGIPQEFQEYAKIEKREPTVYFSYICSSDKFMGDAETRFKDAGIKVVRLCESGDPADVIIRAAKDNNVDMIIMGNRGHGRFSIAVTGSVASKVCNHATSTCITVK